VKETVVRIFVTGASGWIGSAVVPELIGAGHQVLGLARSDTTADAVAGMGADVLRGDLTDTDVLRAGALDSDGVMHANIRCPSDYEGGPQVAHGGWTAEILDEAPEGVDQVQGLVWTAPASNVHCGVRRRAFHPAW